MLSLKSEQQLFRSCMRIMAAYNTHRNMIEAPQKMIFTIGHSNRPFEAFVGVLNAHGIEVVVDVRSQPYSKYTPWFDGDQLKKYLPEAGIKYLFLGDTLGGRPSSSEFYDEEGHVLYGTMAASSAFLGGIERLMKGAEMYRVALMCGEEDPSGCHRRLLVGRVMGERGFQVVHVRGEGRLQAEGELAQEEEAKHPESAQLGMFKEPEGNTWRSLRSASRKKLQPNSLEP